METNAKYIAQKEYKPTPEIISSGLPEVRLCGKELCYFSIPTAVYPYDDYYQAVCDYGLGLSCHEKSREGAQKVITGLIGTFLEDLLDMGTLEKVLTSEGWDKKQATCKSGDVTLWTYSPV